MGSADEAILCAWWAIGGPLAEGCAAAVYG